MKITIDRNGNDIHMTIEREPMSKERFEAVCKLTRLAVGGIVLLGTVDMVGFSAVFLAMIPLLAVGVYKLLKEDF